MIIDIDDYKRWSCARQVGSLFLAEQLVQEAVHKIARKASVNISPVEEENYGLYLNEQLMEYTRTLESYGLKDAVRKHSYFDLLIISIVKLNLEKKKRGRVSTHYFDRKLFAIAKRS